MLASAGAAPTAAGWAFEVKWDGMRAQLPYDGRRVCVRSRPGRDCTAEFPELAAIAATLGGRRVIIDGELVCLDHDGRPDFAALRARLGLRSGSRSTRVAPGTLVCLGAGVLAAHRRACDVSRAAAVRVRDVSREALRASTDDLSLVWGSGVCSPSQNC